MSNQQTVQIKVTLPQELYTLVKINANKFGLSPSTYLRHLALNDSWDKDLPTFPMSAKTEARGLKALEEYKAGKTTKGKDIDKFFESL